MKEFRKTEDGKLICEECGKTLKNEAWFGRHILIHCTKEEYFEKWLKEDFDGICLHCGKNTKILKLKYNKFCSKSCTMHYRFVHGYEVFTEEIKNKANQTFIENYGTYNISAVPCIKLKKEKTNITKYGYKCPLSNKKIRKKRNKTLKERYGDEEYFRTIDFNEKRKQTSLKNYGVEYPSQRQESVENNTKHHWIKSLRLRQYKNSNIMYQGTYELDFLDKYYNTFPSIQRGPRIRYTYNTKLKIHYPDFYIPELNLIIEIKSLYYFNKSKESILLKREAAINQGFKYIIIIDKNYKEFNKIKNTHGITSTI